MSGLKIIYFERRRPFKPHRADHFCQSFDNQVKCILLSVTTLVVELSQNHSHRVSNMGVVEKTAARLV
jgi:hypothetical protein